MSSSKTRIAVITDLHYMQESSSGKFRPQMAFGNAYDPMLELCKFVSDQNIKANWLLCPGDITNQASYPAFKDGWESLRKLKSHLGAKELAATTGNHEVDSRASDKNKIVGLVEQTVDPVGQLQEIEDYPASFLDNPDKRWVYWGRGYEILEDGEFLLVLINSCHFHITMQPNEYERGKISNVVLNSFKENIEAIASNKRFRIVLMHHHPINHHDGGDAGQIEMYNGIRLMELLGDSFYDWIVIHGHKHDPRLIRSQGGSGQPIVFSAGSFGAALNGTLATRTKNQFYIIELESSINSAGSDELRGRIEAFYWTATEWRPATEREHGLPNGCGFSSNLNIDQLSVKIKERLIERGGYMTWAEICEDFYEANYLMPSEIDRLKKVLTRLNVNLGGESRLWFPTQLSAK